MARFKLEQIEAFTSSFVKNEITSSMTVLSSSYSLSSSYIDYSNIDNVPNTDLSFTSSYLTTQSFNDTTSSLFVSHSQFSNTSSYVDYSNVDNVPEIDFGFTSSYLTTQSYNNLSSSFVKNDQTSSLSVLSSSYSKTASYFQENHSFTSSYLTTQSFNGVTSSLFVSHSIFSNTASYVDYSNIDNVPEINFGFTSSYLTTSSYNQLSSSFVKNDQTSSLTVLSSSYSKTASYFQENHSFTSSYLTTQSFNNITSSLFVSHSIFADTSSYIDYSNIDNVPEINFGFTSSYLTTQSFNNITSSLTVSFANTASYIDYSNIDNVPNTDLSFTSSYLTTSSYNQLSSSFVKNSQTSSMSVASASYVKIQDVDFRGTASGDFYFNGNATITGKLTAQEFHTELVSSSILYESGSTKFGDSLDDKHNFTGSINVSGGLLVNGISPLYSENHSFTSSYLTTQSFNNITSSLFVSHSIFSNTASYIDYSNIDNVPNTDLSFTSSYLTTQSFNNITSSLFVSSSQFSQTSSYSLFALTASYVQNLPVIDNSFTASYLTTQSFNNITSSLTVLSSSFSSTSSYMILSLPNDGFYGNQSASVSGPVSGITIGDKIEDGFDKIESVLQKLAPAKPPSISTKTITLASKNSARLSSNGTLQTETTNDTTPTINLVGGALANNTGSNGFYDGDTGTLNAYLNNTVIGSRNLSTLDDSGTYGQLIIAGDGDFWAGTSGKEGFWKSLIANIQITSAIGTIGPHTASLQHTAPSASTPNYIFYIDDQNTTPTVSNMTVITSSGVTYISGVPAISSSGGITASFTVNRAIGRFYRNGTLADLSATGYTTATTSSTSPQVSGSAMNLTMSMSVTSNQQFETSTYTFRGYNSLGTTGTATLTNQPYRVDSNANDNGGGGNRLMSGIGQFPSLGSGSLFINTASLAQSGNEELQRIGGQFRYPVGVNYGTNIPAGPNYIGLNTGSFNRRWATINMGNITNAVNLAFTVNNGTSFPSTVGAANFNFYVMVSGSIPTNGWVDGNANYAGGNPTNNGSPACTAATSTTRNVTFGSAVKTGAVFLRVGIPSGSAVRFGGFSMTSS